MRVLVVNAGSSSLKLRLLDQQNAIEHSADLPAGPGGFDTSSLASVLRGRGEPDAAGHRIGHGGTMFTGPVLHQPKSLAALDAVTALLPGVPAVACFDTAFHATIPPAAATYAVPREWRERYAIRRYARTWSGSSRSTIRCKSTCCGLMVMNPGTVGQKTSPARVARGGLAAGNPCGTLERAAVPPCAGDRKPCVSVSAQVNLVAGYAGAAARAAKIFTIFEGTSEIQRMLIGRTITGLDVR